MADDYDLTQQMHAFLDELHKNHEDSVVNNRKLWEKLDEAIRPILDAYKVLPKKVVDADPVSGTPSYQALEFKPDGEFQTALLPIANGFAKLGRDYWEVRKFFEDFFKKVNDGWGKKAKPVAV